jgi:hypothetical protein
MSDPIVYYRSAGAYLRIGDFRRSIRLLNEIIRRGCLKDYHTTPSNQSILNEMHFLRRIGEYFHFAYLRDGQSDPSDIRNAITYMMRAHNAKGPEDYQIHDNEVSKVVSNLIVFQFLLLSNSNMLSLKTFNDQIKYLDSDINKLLRASQLREKKRGHAMEALALYRLSEGNLIEAKKLISEADNFLKAKNDNPLFVMVTEQIKKFIVK